MKTFSALLAIWAENSPITGEFSSQGPVARSFDVFFDLRLNKNVLVSNRDAGDLKRHRAYYDVTVMSLAETRVDNADNTILVSIHDNDIMLVFWFKNI